MLLDLMKVKCESSRAGEERIDRSAILRHPAVAHITWYVTQRALLSATRRSMAPTTTGTTTSKSNLLRHIRMDKKMAICMICGSWRSPILRAWTASTIGTMQGRTSCWVPASRKN